MFIIKKLIEALFYFRTDTTIISDTSSDDADIGNESDVDSKNEVADEVENLDQLGENIFKNADELELSGQAVFDDDKANINNDKLEVCSGKQDKDESDGATNTLINPVAPQQFYTNEQLRKLEDFREAHDGSGPIILGRDKEKSPFTLDKRYIGRVLNPERRGDDWNCERNAAFWAGGIEAGAEFKIVSRLNSIVTRAQDGFYDYPHTDGWYGGAARELLWLEDNGYTFEPSKVDPKITWAVPPQKPVTNASIRINYGNRTDKDAKEQLDRLEKIARNVARKRFEIDRSNTHQLFADNRQRKTRNSNSRTFGNPTMETKKQKQFFKN